MSADKQDKTVLDKESDRVLREIKEKVEELKKRKEEVTASNVFKGISFEKELDYQLCIDVVQAILDKIIDEVFGK